MDPEPARIAELDVNRPARLLTILRLSDYALVVACGLAALPLVPEAVGQLVAGNLIQGALFLAMAGVFGFAAYTGWRHVGVIDPRVWHSYLFVFPLLSVLAMFMALTGVTALIAKGRAAFDDMTDMILLMTALYYAAIAVPGFVCVLLLRRARVPSTNVSLETLLESLAARGHGPSHRVRNVPRARLAVGLLWGIAGGLVLLAYLLLPTDMVDGRPPLYLRFADQIRFGAFFLLVRARRYFQVSAESLLAADKRAPVLFLRSFADDERQRYSSSQRALLDFSLETRLANHFSRFGPFIAIGSPKEKLPQPGAARIRLQDDEWQSRVLRWMASASLIIMYSGKTEWVNWELRKVIESRAATRLILMFPEVKSWRSSRRRKDIASRVAHLREVFKDTPWNEELMAFDNFAGARAMLFRPDGSMEIVKSRSRGRDAYHLAALVAHYRMFAQPGSLGEAATQASSSLRRRAKTFAIAAAAALALFAGVRHFSTSPREPLLFKKGELYYSDPVTAAQAKSVGEYLVGTGFFTDEHPVTVKLARQTEVYQLKFAVNPAHVNEPLTALEFGMIGSNVSHQALAGAPTEVILSDSHMRPVKVLPRTEELTFRKGSLYYTAPVTEQQARAVGGVLVEIGLFNDADQVPVLLSRDDRGNQLKFVVEPGRASDPQVVTVLSATGHAVANVLHGQRVAIYVCNERFEPLGNGAPLPE